MTLKQFSVKYDIPLAQVKAAMGCEKFMTTDKANKEYDEEELRSETFHYLFRDVIFCIDRMQKNRRHMDRIAEIVQKESGDGAK